MNAFIKLGIALVMGLMCGKLMNKMKIPAVAGYIIAGLIIGTSGFNIIDSQTIDNLAFLSDFALGIIAFNIGSELNITVIKQLGKSIFIIAACEALGAFVLVFGVMLLLGQDFSTALILGAVSSATAPAATVMVLKEYRAKGPLTSTLLGVVAVDDAICLMIYAIASSIAKVFVKHEVVTVYKVLIHPIMEIGLSLVAGGVLGVALSYALKKAKNESETLTFVTGAIVGMIGISTAFHLSPLLSSMAMGVMVANVSSQAHRAFVSIESFSPPVIAAFFTLAGSRLDISLLPHIGVVGAAYFIFRTIGKIFGASIGGKLSNAPKVVQNNIGFGLLSQVGVAVGLAILVSKEFAGSELGSVVITILLATTILTEIVGPLATKRAIVKSKEAQIA